MQTFLPYPSFTESAYCLDYRRLGKQRVEAYQIYRTLTGAGKGWENHPATRMWRGHELALAAYFNAIKREWVRRGYKNTMLDLFVPDIPFAYELPNWFGNKEFHASHRSNLLRKDPVWYSQFDWKEPDNLPYVWPV